MIRKLYRWLVPALALVALIVVVRAAQPFRGPLRPALMDSAQAGELDPFKQDYQSLPPEEAANYWNDWAEHYSHEGPPSKVFACFTKAIQTDGKRSLFYENLATSIFLYRKDAAEYYQLTEQQVFDLALSCYRAALQRDPSNYGLAKEIARSFYVIRPARTEDALGAWNDALQLAATDRDRQDVYVNMARLRIGADQLTEAEELLRRVTLPEHADMKAVLESRVAAQRSKLAGVDPQPEAPAPKPASPHAKARKHRGMRS
ncbi:MAG: hypothetical protein AB1705_03320 [Verrucomicrobiota bacterium]